MLNANYRTGAYLRAVTSIKTQSIVEIKFTQEMGEVLAVYPQVSPSTAEISSGRINYGGRLVCTVVYCDEDGKLCRVQKGAEFSHRAEDEALAPSQQATYTLSCERSALRREGSAYVVSVVVGADISVSDSAERSFIASLDGAVCRNDDGVLYNAVDFSGESEIEDDFDCVLSDILMPSAKALVLDCTVKSGVAEISGEIYLSLLGIRDGLPVCLDRVIPFKAELTAEDASVTRRAFCSAQIKELSVEGKVNEERGKCDVTFSSTLAFSGRYYEEENVSFISDAFSLENRLKLTYAEETTEVCSDIKVYSERVSGLCAAKAELDYTCQFLAAALPKAEYSLTDSGIAGSVSAILIYSREGEIHSTDVDLPFSVTLAGLNVCKTLSVAVCGISIRQRAEGECEAEALLKISAQECTEYCVKYLTGAEEGDAVPCVESALSVYMPTAGDGLWETAKKLCAKPEDIEKTNPDLAFPLTGKERIVVFRPRTAQ